MVTPVSDSVYTVTVNGVLGNCTLWLNLGDCYAAAWPSCLRNVMGQGSLPNAARAARPPRLAGALKEKDLVGVPTYIGTLGVVGILLQSIGWFGSLLGLGILALAVPQYGRLFDLVVNPPDEPRTRRKRFLFGFALFGAQVIIWGGILWFYIWYRSSSLA